MNKQDRKALIAELIVNGETVADVINEVAMLAKVKAETVKKDIEELNIGTSEKEEVLETEAESKTEAVVTFLTQAELDNPQLAKGRLTSYTPEDKDLEAVHAELEKVQFDMMGNKKSVPFVQMFSREAWRRFEKVAKDLGYNHVRVLFNPYK